MKLRTKHEIQQPIILSDFSGGLNTSSNLDGIAQNQLANALNVEVDQANGRLKTVAGTVDVLTFNDIFAAVYDEINEILLLVTNDKKVYTADIIEGTVGTEVGTLSGDLYPLATRWEDGALLASGGKLQYFNGTTLETIADSPISTNVYVRAGRVMVTDDANNVRYSGIGDESNWTEDTNDDASAKFVEIGYKDGGKLFGMINLSSDVLFIKDNRRLYRLSGEYPKWSLNEVSRNVEVRSRLGFCAIADSVFVIGRNEVQNIQTTNAYGDMKPQSVSDLITAEVQSLPTDTLLRYVPPLNQIWAVAGKSVLVFDLVVKSWYKRQFNSPVVDVLPIDNEVFIIKQDRVSKLNARSFNDAGEPLHWWFQAQRLLSLNEYLLKRVQVSYTPMDRLLTNGQIRVGAVIVDLPAIDDETTRKRFLTTASEYIYEDEDPIYSNPKPIFTRPTVLVENRNVYRNKFLDIRGSGNSGGIILNAIMMTVAEV